MGKNLHRGQFGLDVSVAVFLVAATLVLALIIFRGTSSSLAFEMRLNSKEKKATEYADYLVKEGLVVEKQSFFASHLIDSEKEGRVNGLAPKAGFNSLQARLYRINDAGEKKETNRIGDRVCIKRLALRGNEILVIEACVS